MAIIRVTPGANWQNNVLRAVSLASDGDELRFYCEGAMIDGSALIDREFSGLDVKMTVEPLGHWYKIVDALSAVFQTQLADRPQKSTQALGDQIDELLDQEGFDDVFERQDANLLYSAEHAVGIYVHRGSATSLRDYCHQLSENQPPSGLRAMIVIRLSPGSQHDLEAADTCMGMTEDGLNLYRINVKIDDADDR